MITQKSDVKRKGTLFRKGLFLGAIFALNLGFLVSGAHAQTVANASFETPSTGNYITSSTGTSWTFTNNAGIQHNGSAYSGSSVLAPDGTQTGFLQGSGSLSSISQSVSFPAAGTYTISFQGAQRFSQVQPIQVKVDANVVGTYTPASASFASITTATFTVTAGSHTLTFTATDSTGDKTTFIDQISIAVSGGGIPGAPTALNATAGNAQVGLTWTASSGATTYNVYRGTTAGGESTTPIATGIAGTSYSNTGLSNGTAYYFKVAAVNTSGTSAYSNEASATPTAGGGGSATFANASFETPATSGYTYSSTGSSWTFVNNAGIQHNGSAYSDTTAVATDGVQTGFVQGISSTLGSMSQSVNFGTAGSYTISFQAARRYGLAQPIQVSVDSSVVGTYTPASNTFAPITTASFTVTTGNHTITFAATDNTADKTSFIDSLSIASGSGGSAPAAPTGLGATGGNAQIVLNWTASSGATSYNLYRGTATGAESTTPIATGVTGTTYTNTGLSNGTAYYYKVAAVNASGTSAYSNEANATPSAGGSAPSAPTALSATAGNAQVALSWTGSSGATSYNVYRGTTAGGESATPVVTGLTGTTYTNTGLSNGTAYYYKVAAVNSFGTSGYSNESSATPAAGGGSATFANASFEAPSTGGYTYSSTGSSWTFVNNAGIQHNGSAYGATNAPDGVQTGFVQGISSTLGSMSQSVNFSAAGTYTISFQGAQRFSQVQPIQVKVDSTVVGTYTPSSNSFASITTASFTVTAGSHTITFAATDNTADKSSFIDLVSIGSGSGGSAPAAPAGLAATGGNALVNLNWTASSGATSYNVYRGTTAGGESTTPIATGITGTTYSNTGLSNGTAYYYKVAAVNGSGTSGYSNEANATPSSAPAAPAGLGATPGNAQVALTWTASSGATSYNVYRGTTAGGESTTPVATGLTGTTYTNTGLSNGTAYYFKVAAVSGSGTSGYSNEASATPSSGGGAGDIDLTGYTLTFSDEFDTLSVSTSSPKGASEWYYVPPYGSAGNYSASIWDASAFSVSGGILTDKAFLDGSSNWHSGNLSSVDTTKAGFSQQYGYFEIRCKMPDSGSGAWPAFWLETTSSYGAGATNSEEIDIFEWYGVCNTAGNPQPYVQQATHNWNIDGSQNQTLPYLYSPQTTMPGKALPWQGYHIYGCKIDPAHITWYIDGIQTNQIATATSYLTGPFYVMVDYALGGGWPLSGMVNNSSLDVDWVRVYSLP